MLGVELLGQLVGIKLSNQLVENFFYFFYVLIDEFAPLIYLTLLCLRFCFLRLQPQLRDIFREHHHYNSSLLF